VIKLKNFTKYFMFGTVDLYWSLGNEKMPEGIVIFFLDLLSSIIGH
jgi:hypothetical protein